MNAAGAPPRYLPDLPFPAYAYVPGVHPHPVRDPQGHSHGQPEPEVATVDPAAWRDSRAFLAGVDLFNHGYYWEAHEAWEALWRAYPHGSDAARLLNGLIKLTAAGVKLREGRPRGVARHAAGAAGLFEAVTAPRLFGLDRNELTGQARRLCDQPPGTDTLGIQLCPR